MASDKLESILLHAAAIPECERDAFLDQACGGDSALRAQISQLMQEPDETHTIVQPAPSSPSGTLPNGALLASRFRIKRMVGVGGMGEVYEAEDLELSSTVALKIIRPQLFGSRNFPSRFRREVQLARQVTHPNVCRVFEFGRDGTNDAERIFFTMEYLEGETLRDYLKRRGKLSPHEAIDLIRQMAAGLTALHEKGIVHRDFKPGNVIVVKGDGGQERAVIGDFGLAHAVAPDEPAEALTSAGVPVGTPAYMAPEQMLGQPVTPATDIYALGLVVYEMATGVRPFRTDKAVGNAMKRLVEPPVPPHQHTPGLLPNWESTILQCLSLEQADRPSSPSAVVEQLDGRSLVPATPAQASLSFRKRAERIVAACAVLIALVFGGVRLRDLWFASNAPKPVVVLPFKVMQSEAGLTVFADGLFEMITSRLSHLEGANRNLLIVPSTEVRSQSVKTPGDAKERFDAGRVVEGTLEKVAGNIRLSLSIVDTKQMRRSGPIVVEEPRLNVESLQAAAVAKLAGALNVSVTRGRSGETTGSASSAAQDFYVQARGYLQRPDQMTSIDNAISMATRSLEIEPKYPLAHSAMCEAYWYKYELTREAKWMDDAFMSCGTAIELNPRLPEAHIAMGRVHLGAARHEEARRDFETALTVDPRSTDAYQGLANAYAGLKQFDKAEATYRNAIALRPGDWTGYKQLGLFFYRRGDFDKAIEQYEKVIALTPDNAHGYVNMAAFWQRKEQPQRAKSYLIRARQIDPSRTSTLTSLGKIYYDEGQHARAIDLYQQALKGSIRSYVLWTNLGFAYKRSGNHVKAKEAFAEANKILEAELLINGKNAEVLSYLARNRVASGERDGVEALLAKALEYAPTNREVLIRTAETYAELGQDERATSITKEALQAGYSQNALKRSVDLRRLFPRLGVKL